MLEKSFDPGEIETALYAQWEREHAFSAEPGSGKPPFAVMIPPPNVTGTLHAGHALNMTLQDILVRWRRMQGFDVLWQVGTDHAGISTQLVVERTLREEGTSREALGRDAFVERVWRWKDQSGSTITRQLRRLGCSFDWQRERFTLDAGLSEAVREVFVTLHAQGLIYRDRRLVNWDPVFRSALSDLEVESREVRGSLWHLRYPLADDPSRAVIVATTRPETMLGDVAVAVHPEDERYAELVGRELILPLVGRRIRVVADSYSDPEKGTGAVKITPAHDFNDFAVGRRHDLPMPTILDEGGSITLGEIEGELRTVAGLAAPGFVRGLAGLSREAARERIVAELDRLGLLDRTEPHVHQVPHADRGGAVIEPRLTTQWYCDAATLARPAIEAVEQGRVEFLPRGWENTFFAWMRDIQPWCISRQLWWGHQIPAWYGPDGEVFVAHDEAGAQAKADAHYGQRVALTRDPDVLDTWFSSGLWPFSTQGWPRETVELGRYYPGSVLVTGHDIIFFWVARMMMLGLHFMGEVPFRTVFLHGLVRDERGRKMSKSLGNGIDPLEMIDQFGADALRYTVCALTGIGRDVRLSPRRVEENRSFVTKLWNAARLCEMNEVRPEAGFSVASLSHPLAVWIAAEAERAVAEATAALEALRFDEYAAAIYRFSWNLFCDWFLELAKPLFGDAEVGGQIRGVAAHVLGLLLRLLHPIAPFVTETLWGQFGFGPRGSLIRTAWPETASVPQVPPAASREIGWLIRVISEIRALRGEMGVPPARLAPVLLRDASAETLGWAGSWREALARLARISQMTALDGPMPKDAAQLVVDEATLILPLDELIDIGAERARLAREIERVAGEIGKVERKLDNPDFVARAKPEVVEENRARLAGFAAERERLGAALSRLGG